MTSTLTCYGGTGSVTGANFLLEIGNKKILVDCGLVQGDPDAQEINYQPFVYDPKTIDILIVTHAHTDHIGRIPKLVRDGFRGIIYSTLPTKELSEVMFDDAVGILSKDAEEAGLEKMYEKKDIEQAMALWKTIPYHAKQELGEGISFTFYDAGHVLGSGMVLLERNDRSILFTGDLGNSPNMLLRDTEIGFHPNYILTESVYGDRNHDHPEERTGQFEAIIEDTIHQGGVLMIPTFSLERTQELLFELNNLVEHGRIPKVPVFLDSPLAISVTSIYQNSTEFFKKEARALIHGGDNIFSFPGLINTKTTEESKAINDVPAPKIILAGSGMMNGGRIIHHARRYLPDAKNTLLFVGYQAPFTLGRVIYDKTNPVKIFGEEVPVRARIEMISGYSGHKDSDGIVEFIGSIGQRVEKVFCAMGETKSSLHLAQRLRDHYVIEAVVPKLLEKIMLEL